MTHARRMRNVGAVYIQDLVYGAVDGTITTFAVAAGAVGADLRPNIVVILGLANLFGDGFSMAASNYLSKRSVQPPLTRRATPAQRTDVDVTAIGGAFATFVAFVVTGFVPLLGFLVSAVRPTFRSPFVLSAVLTALTFVGIGAAKGRFTGTSRSYAAIQTLLLGGAASSIAFFVGKLISRLVD